MKVYAVMDPIEDWEGPVAIYATRELAEAAIAEDVERLRRQWFGRVDLAGKPIPRQGYKDGKGGIIPQVHEHPGSFDDWLRSQGQRWIDEWDVIEGPPSGSQRVSRPNIAVCGGTEWLDLSVNWVEATTGIEPVYAVLQTARIAPVRCDRLRQSPASHAVA